MSSPLYSGPKRREEKRREAHPSRAKKDAIYIVLYN
jgi:hypothetical protein